MGKAYTRGRAQPENRKGIGKLTSTSERDWGMSFWMVPIPGSDFAQNLLHPSGLRMPLRYAEATAIFKSSGVHPYSDGFGRTSWYKNQPASLFDSLKLILQPWDYVNTAVEPVGAQQI